MKNDIIERFRVLVGTYYFLDSTNHFNATAKLLLGRALLRTLEILPSEIQEEMTGSLMELALEDFLNDPTTPPAYRELFNKFTAFIDDMAKMFKEEEPDVDESVWKLDELDFGDDNGQTD